MEETGTLSPIMLLLDFFFFFFFARTESSSLFSRVFVKNIYLSKYMDLNAYKYMGLLGFR